MQPAFRKKEAVHYREEKPHILLQPYIWCYWELKTTGALPEDYRYSVVADGCMDIFFAPDNLADATIAGFNSSHTEFLLGRQFRYVGVRFLPGMFTRLLGIAASELSETVAPMADVFPAFSKRLAAELDGEASLPAITALFNDYFLRLAERPAWPADPRFDEAMHRLINSPAEAALEKGLQTGLSARQLRRLFHFYVGDSPKVFSSVVRFQRLLHLQSVNATAFAEEAWLDAGYYDQAHFIKEFRRFGGLTPGSIG